MPNVYCDNNNECFIYVVELLCTMLIHFPIVGLKLLFVAPSNCQQDITIEKARNLSKMQYIFSHLTC